MKAPYVLTVCLKQLFILKSVKNLFYGDIFTYALNFKAMIRKPQVKNGLSTWAGVSVTTEIYPKVAAILV